MPRARPRSLPLLALALACGGAPRGECEPAPAAGALGSVCGFRHPEDVAYAPRAGVLLVSQLASPDAPGSIAALALDGRGEPAAAPRTLWPAEGAPPRGPGEPPCPPPDPEHFAPHGLAVAAGDAGERVAVVAHGARESVELFELEGRGVRARLRWRGCVRLPARRSGNDVVFDAGGGLAVTHYHPPASGARALLHLVAAGVGLDTGEVLAWRPGRGWRVVAASAGPLPNGIALSATDAVVWATHTGAGRLAATPFAPGARIPSFAVELDGRPDNLAWSPRGPLLVVVHRSGWRAALCQLGRRPCRAPWSLLEVDPLSLAVRERLRHDGSVVGGVSSVAEVRGRFYFGAIRDDRIGVWRPAPR